MKNTSAIVLVVAFAAFVYAAPPSISFLSFFIDDIYFESNAIHFFAVDNYERLDEALEDALKVLGEQARTYVELLIADNEKEKEAVQSGNKEALVADLRQTAKDTKAGASHAKKNEKLYELASETAPVENEQLAQAIEDGKATIADAIKLTGEDAQEISEDDGIPLC